MRIAFLSAEYPPETAWGGISRYVSTIAPALVARGHEVHVVSCADGQTVSDTLDRGVEVHRRPITRLRGLGRVVRSPVFVMRLNGAFSGWLEMRRLGLDPDVIEAP